MNREFRIENKEEGGYIALISAIIITLVLFALTFSVSSSGYFSRFNSLNGELKRVSLGLAESCENVALLKLAQNYDYTGNETITFGNPPLSCTIGTINPAPAQRASPVTSINPIILATANYQGAFTKINVGAKIQNPNV